MNYVKRGWGNSLRIMLDTNVLISLILFPSSKLNSMITTIWEQHQLVLSSFVVEELKAVTIRKFPQKLSVVDMLLTQMSFELVYTPSEMEKGLFEIRDEKDYPVLYTAIIENVDILITGDKDFSDIIIEKPDILTPSEFIEKYVLT